MLYWNQIAYTFRNYNAGLNIQDIIPSYYFRDYSFTGLPYELGGIRRKRKRGLEKRLE